MRQPDTEIDLDVLTDAILTSVSAAFPIFETVKAYPEDRTSLPTPACLIELVDMEPVDDMGTEQLPVMARFSAQLIFGFRDPEVKRKARKIAAAVALHIRARRWGLPTSPAEVIAIAPDEFDPDLDRFEVWRVEWQQVIHIGPSIWSNDGVLPTQVMGAVAPEIGSANEAGYIPINEVEV